MAWANLVLTAAVVLSALFIGSYFFVTDADLQANLGLVSVTYMIFIWPAYFVLKLTERKPIPATAPVTAPVVQLRTQQTAIQKDILRDISKHVYLKETHMQDQLQALKLGIKSDSELPKLTGYREEDHQGHYALVLQFDSNHVSIQKWQERQSKLDTFFGRDVDVIPREGSQGQVELALVCKN